MFNNIFRKTFRGLVVGELSEGGVSYRWTFINGSFQCIVE